MTDKDLAKNILTLVGGERNIKSFTNCVTRLRFTLKDSEKAQTAKIKQLDGVLDVQNHAGQYQVIVGVRVDRIANEIRNMMNRQDKYTEEEGAEKKGVLTRLFDTLSGILIPSLPPLIGGGMIKGFLYLFWELGWLEWGAPLFDLLDIISDGMFYYYPFLLAVSAAKKFNTNQFMALAVAGSLMSPTILSGVSSGTEYLSVFGFLKIPYIDYSSSVIPIILSVLLMSYVYRFFQKRIPDIVSVIFTPMLSLLIVIPISLFALAPLGYYIGEGLAVGVQAIIDFSPLLSGFVLGALRPFTVLTGTHHAVRAIVSQQLATYGYTTIGAVNYMSTMAQAAAALGVYLVVKDKKMKNLSFSAAISGFLGVTEPALYSIIVKYKYVFFATAVGGGVGGAICAVFGGAEYALVMSSLLTIPATFGDGFMGIAIGLPASIIVTIVLIWFGRDKINQTTIQMEIQEKTETEGTQMLTLASPVQGKLLSMDKMRENIYSSGLLGEAIYIQAAEGLLYAPFDGEISTVFHTNHAIGLISDDGLEVLLHVGLNTGKLDDTYYHPCVKIGDKVKKGDLLMKFDSNDIEHAGYDSSVIVAVVNSSDYADIFHSISDGAVNLGEQVLTIVK